MDKCLNTSGEELTANSKFLKLYFFSHVFPGFLLHFSNITEFTFCLDKFFLHTISFDKKISNVKSNTASRDISLYMLFYTHITKIWKNPWYVQCKYIGFTKVSIFQSNFHFQVMAFTVAPYHNDLSIHYNESLWTIRPLSSF